MFSLLQVVSTSSHIVVVEKEVHQGFPCFSKYTVSAMDPQTALTASVSISSPSYSQTLVIPVTFIHLADPSAAMQGQCAFCDAFTPIFVFHYQSPSLSPVLRALTVLLCPSALCQQPLLLLLAWMAVTPCTAL